MDRSKGGREGRKGSFIHNMQRSEISFEAAVWSCKPWQLITLLHDNRWFIIWEERKTKSKAKKVFLVMRPKLCWKVNSILMTAKNITSSFKWCWGNSGQHYQEFTKNHVIWLDTKLDLSGYFFLCIFDQYFNVFV